MNEHELFALSGLDFVPKRFLVADGLEVQGVSGGVSGVTCHFRV
jgi:hypothetical protein